MYNWILISSALLFLAGCSSPNASPRATSDAVQTQEMSSEDWPASFEFGREATAEEIAAWDIDIMPDGTGLPKGSGTVLEGEAVYRAKCMACHGATGIEGPNDQLVGRIPNEVFRMDEDLLQRRHKAIGSYWPYSTTLFDYIRRAMPQLTPGSLSNEEVYALTAYILYLNDLILEDAVMDRETLPAIEMPARNLFVPDDRLEFDQVH